MFKHLVHARRSAFALLCASLLTAGTQTAMASGLSGGGASSGGGLPPREIDQLYEYGKSLYLGRTPGVRKTRYCLKIDGEAQKLRGRNLKSWRGRPQLEFANALYDCEAPEKLALLNLEKEQVAYVLYYLNKRYKLRLDTQ